MHTVGHVFFFHGIVSSTAEGECFGVPDLPIIIEQGGVEGQWFVETDKREAEKGRGGRVFVTGLGNPHMRYKIAWNVETGQLDAVGVSLNSLKKSGSNTLSGLSSVVPWKHPVDIGIVHGPKSLFYVHGERIDRRNDQNFMPGHQPAFFLQCGQPVYDL